MGIYNISPAAPYLRSLARFLLDRFSPDEFEKAVILLPGRRASRSLQEELVSESGGGIILPEISPIGDIETKDFLHSERGISSSSLVGKLEQKLKLTQLIYSHKSMNYNLVQASALADKLMTLLGEFGDYESSIESLSEYPGIEESRHMQLILEFILSIDDKFSRELGMHGKQDFAGYRKQVINEFTNWLKHNRQTYPVIIAGSFAEFPAVQRLIQTVCELENGYVILPKSVLDSGARDNEMDFAEESHPIYYINNILAACNTPMNGVKEITCNFNNSGNSREKLISNFYLMRAFTPSELDKNSPKLFEGIEYLTAESQTSEAAIIALKTRYLLNNNNNNKIGIITEDEKFITLLDSYMSRLGISMDDAIGIPVCQTQTFNFFISIAGMVINDSSPLKMLSCLKHSYIKSSHAEELEILLFRSSLNLDSYQRILTAAKDKISQECYEWLLGILEICEKFRQITSGEFLNFSEALRAHLEAAENLYPEIWQSEEGSFVLEVFSELLENSSNISSYMPVTQYCAFLEASLAGYRYRKKLGWAPGVSLISPEESRNIDFDCVIIPDFNENTWPGFSEASPWMNKKMREDLGLPSQKASLCFNFYNFISNLNSPEIFITRATKKNGTETSPSRYLGLLQKIVPDSEVFEYMRPKFDWHHLSDKFFEGDYFTRNSAEEQKATIDPDIMPKYLSATSAETLITNPYGFYGQKILRLTKLNELEEEPGMAEFGNFVHEVIEKYSQQLEGSRDYELFLKLGRSVLEGLNYSEFINNLWWPKFLRIAAEFIQYYQQRKEGLNRSLAETRGTAMLDINGRQYYLTAIADRIEVNKDLTINILDYKTGYVPGNKEVNLGLSPQLVIEAIIARKAGFPELEKIMHRKEIQSLIYTKISPGDPICSETNIKVTPELLDRTEGFIYNLIRHYLEPGAEFKSTPLVNHQPRFNDYEHLARKES
jgi:ATP-dependent helicase/nuclease subunit B